MKVLFLDIQNNNKYYIESKICLINQKVVNENFEEISKKETLINPCADFDEYILKNLPYHKNDFDNAKTFEEVYPELKNDLEREDQVIVVRNGYNDIKLLKEQCSNKNLSAFTFKFYDFNEILVAFMRQADNTEDMPKAVFYRNGAENVDLMAKVMKYICTKMNKSLENLLEIAVNGEGYFQDGLITFRRTKDVMNPENTFNSNLNKNSNYRVFLRLLENVKKVTENENILEGKHVSISTEFEISNFKEMLNLVVLLKEAGADYVTNMNDCDIFINYETLVNGKVKRCSRLEQIKNLKTDGKVIEVITLDDILAKLGTTPEKLSEMPIPEIDYIYSYESRKARMNTKYIKVIKNFGKV